MGEKPERMGPSVTHNSVLHHEYSKHIDWLFWFPASFWPFPMNYPTYHSLTPVPQTVFSRPCHGDSNYMTTKSCHWHKRQLATHKGCPNTLPKYPVVKTLYTMSVTGSFSALSINGVNTNGHTIDNDNRYPYYASELKPYHTMLMILSFPPTENTLNWVPLWLTMDWWNMKWTK